MGYAAAISIGLPDPTIIFTGGPLSLNANDSRIQKRAGNRRPFIGGGPQQKEANIN